VKIRVQVLDDHGAVLDEQHISPAAYKMGRTYQLGNEPRDETHSLRGWELRIYSSPIALEVEVRQI
jgi:hypothetical protein